MVGQLEDVGDCVVGDFVVFGPLLDGEGVDGGEDGAELLEEVEQSAAGVLAFDAGVALEQRLALEADAGVDCGELVRQVALHFVTCNLI